MSRWSKREIGQLRRRMSSQGRDLHEIAAEIRAVAGCSPLVAYRMAAGLSQPELVEKVAATSPSVVLDQTLLSRLEAFPSAGSRAPQATQIVALAAVFATSPLRLLSPDALDRLDEHERAVLIRIGSAHDPSAQTPPSGARGTTSPAQHLVPPDVDLERQVEMAARRALRFAAGAEGSNVGPETLDQLREEVANLAAAYQQQPLPVLLGDLTELQDVAFRLLEGRQRPADTADLYLLTGVLSGMLAKASHDLGNSHAAMTQARTAFICAENIGHAGLSAWTSGLRSMIAYWAGRANQAVQYAQQGADAAARTRGTASVWLAAQEARGWAVLGDADRCQDALNRTEAARAAATPDELDDLGGLMTFAIPRQQYYAADAQVWLPGLEDQAATAARTAIAAYADAIPQDRSFSDEAGAQAALALARIAQGDVEGATEALRPLLALPVEQRIEGIVESANRVRRALQAPRFQGAVAARTMQQEIEAYSRTPAGAALPPGR